VTTTSTFLYGSIFAALTLLTACHVEFDGDGERFKENFHSTFKVDPGARLSVDNENGAIEVISWERNEVEMNGTKYARSESELHDVKIESTASPMAISIRTLRQHTMHGNSGATYTIRVPRRMIVDRLHSTNGPISVEGVISPVTVESTNGALHFTRVEGRIEGTTTNGTIELSRCIGDARLNSTNGRIEGDLEGGLADVRTTNGDIQMRLSKLDGKGPLRVSTSNGQIDVTLDSGHEMRASTTNSSITLRLPSDANAQLQARTSHSSVTSEFETIQHHEGDDEGERKTLNTRIGSGGPVIDLSTSNGSIHIIKR